MAVRFPLAGAATLMLILAACAGGGAAQPTEAPGQPTEATGGCAGSGGEAVQIADFSFIPAEATTSVGGTVTWTNADSAPHTVTFDDGGPDCGRLNNGASVSRTFDSAGTFAYHCSIHPSMRGSVVVQ